MAQKDEYVALRIMSAKSADEGGKSRVPDSEIVARSKTRVERRPNGDVVLKDIPMVNQGPKGYCVPATWERVMRYMGVPADMYVLAMAGNSGAGGGTSVAAIAAGWGRTGCCARAATGTSAARESHAAAEEVFTGGPFSGGGRS